MSEKQKHLRFEDLQPHVDMLCDALENKGASPSGLPYADGVSEFANKYRELLTGIREKQIGYTLMFSTLHNLEIQCMKVVGNNQRYRKEYNKYTGDR
jgi:hypothetical protein